MLSWMKLTRYLIDEARTPLIISGQAQRSTDLYFVAARFVRMLKEEEHFTVDIKTKGIALTDEGVARRSRKPLILRTCMTLSIRL